MAMMVPGVSDAQFDAALSFEGCDQFEAIEAIFSLQFGRN
jgi:hypothetical protein